MTWQALGGSRELCALMVGLDSAGKTLAMRRMCRRTARRGFPFCCCSAPVEDPLDEVAMPTIAFNADYVVHRGLHLSVMDLSGAPDKRELWKHFYTRTEALVFVVDSADSARFEEAAAELRGVLGAEQVASAPLLVLATKQDLPGAAPADKVAEAMGLQGLSGRPVTVLPCSGLTGAGLKEGLDWLVENL
eukprot:m51a1_g2106 hypothetical protein (190) ;mRNA; r:1613111-1613680